MFCVTFSFTLVKQRLESSGFSLIFKVLKVSEAILLIPVNLIWKLFIHVTNIRKSSTSWVGSVIQLNQLELKFTWTSCGRDACWLLNVPATCYCISGTDLFRQFTCCHTEIEAADQTFYLTQSQYTDTEPTSLSADPVMSDACCGREVLTLSNMVKYMVVTGVKCQDDTDSDWLMSQLSHTVLVYQT